MTEAELAALAAVVRDAPGLQGKRDLELVRSLEADIDGDDAALVAHADGWLVLCGEAMAPAFLRADPFGAGAAAVVTNVSDVRAMGGTPLGIVDMLVSPDHAHAQVVLDGLKWASGLLGVPIVGGHLTIGHEPALSATCTGTVRVPLRASAARPGDALVVAYATDGRYMSEDGTFWTALHDRDPARLRTDGEALVEVAEAGWCHAARDISMPGAAGSLLQMVELAGCGATLDVERLPRPADVDLGRWLLTFPSYGFLLAAAPEHAADAVRAFTARGLAAAVCGSFDVGRALQLAAGPDRRITVWDLGSDRLTGLG
jgi:selenophosphate synthetase-related protein